MASLVKPRFRFLGIVFSISFIWIFVTLTFRNPASSSISDPISADDISSDVTTPTQRSINGNRVRFDSQKGQLVWFATGIDAGLQKKNYSKSQLQIQVSPKDQSPVVQDRQQLISPKSVHQQFISQKNVRSPLKTSKSSNKRYKQKMQYFQSVTTPVQREILYDLTVKFTVMCHLLNITYFMYGGTLLGSYRHHDLIPWDDDIDLIVDRQQREQLYDSLITLPDDYHVVRAGSRFKFFNKNSQRTSKFPWKWPYLDISFFYQNATHIWDSSREFSNYVYDKRIVFPLHDRPFGLLFLKSPHDAYANLRKTYSNTDCSTHFYSHKYESNARKRVSVPCRSLNDVVSFVHRSPATEGVKETLMMGTKVLHSIIVQEPTYAISAPYKIELLLTI